MPPGSTYVSLPLSLRRRYHQVQDRRWIMAGRATMLRPGGTLVITSDWYADGPMT